MFALAEVKDGILVPLRNKKRDILHFDTREEAEQYALDNKIKEPRVVNLTGYVRHKEAAV